MFHVEQFSGVLGITASEEIAKIAALLLNDKALTYERLVAAES